MNTHFTTHIYNMSVTQSPTTINYTDFFFFFYKYEIKKLNRPKELKKKKEKPFQNREEKAQQ